MLTAGLLFAYGCGKPDAAPEPILRTVRSAVVSQVPLSTRATFSGAVQAGTESRLSFQVSGRVNRVNVKVGQRVQQGAVIATLDPTDFSIQLQEAIAGLEQARASATGAEATYERTRKLYANSNASRQELDNARASRDGARSALAAANQAVLRLRRQLSYATLKAPANGTISGVDVEANEVTTAGGVVAVIQVGRQLDVAVEVPGSLVNRLAVGSLAEVSATAASEQPLGAKVSEIGVPRGGASVFPVTVRLTAPPKALRAGMAANVSFQLEARGDDQANLEIPTTAVGEDRQGRFVFLLEPSPDGVTGQVKRQAVKVGPIRGGGVAIAEGLRPGMTIVTAGVSRIRDGLTVKLPKRTGEH